MSSERIPSQILRTGRERAIAAALAAIVAALALVGGLVFKHDRDEHARQAPAQVLSAAPHAPQR
jgi:hypothetical protein